MKMEKNTGIPYETFTQHIFNCILNQDTVNTIEVKHDVILQGKTTSHQIDVYWEFENGGIKYSTIVQAKDWNQNVTQGNILQFKAILDDLPNQPRGIFVTKKGYQKGAKEVSEKNGIVLYELREATDKDLETRIKTIIVNITAFVPHSTDVNFIPDNDWVKEERLRLNIKPDNLSLQISGMENELVFIDTKDNKITNVHTIINNFYPIGFQELLPTKKTYEFNTDAFIETGNQQFPKLKIKSVEATISVSKIEEVIQVGGEDIIKFILKNVISDSENLFDKDMGLIK
jgi:hypothetical protein